MRITGWAVDGFGRFHRDQVADLPGGLVIVHGPNEAGKTTLMDFFRGMLFGFPRRNSRRRHEPLDGGTLGGRLFVRTSAGTDLTIERGASQRSLRIHSGDGELPPGTLAGLLGGATEQLFDNVFAVDLDALQALGALGDDAVRDRIFSAGVLGAGQSASAALAALDTRRSQLWKPNGRGAGYELKALARRLDDARAQLDVAQQAALGLGDLRHRIGERRDEVSALRKEAGDLRWRRLLLDAVVDLWPPWSRSEQARAELDAGGPVPPLDDDHPQRLDDAVRTVEEAETNLQRARSRLAGAAEECRRVVVDRAVLDNRNEIDAVAEQRQLAAERSHRAAELEEELERQREELTAELCRLGPGCDQAWLARHDVSVEVESTLRAAAEPVTRATAALERAVAEAAEHQRRDEAEVAALAKLRAERASAGPGAVPRPQAARLKLERLARLGAALEQLERSERADRAEEAQLAAAAAAARAPVPAWLPVALAALAALSALAGLAGVAAGAPLPGVAALVVAVVLAVVAARCRIPEPLPGPVVVPPSADDTARRRAQVEALAAELGAPPRPDPSQMASAEARLTAELARAERLQQALEDEQRATRLAEEHRRADRAAVAAAQAALDTATSRWHRWLVEHDLPPNLDPAGATEFLAVLRRAGQLQRRLQRDQNELHRLLAEVETYERRVAACAGALGVAVSAGTSAAVEELVRRREAAVTAQHEAAALDRTVEEAGRDIERAERARAEAGARLRDVLAEVGAASTDEARAVHARHRARRERLALVEAAEEALTIRCGAHGEQRDEALVLLAEADPLAWEQERDGIEKRLEKLQEDDDAVTAELTRATDQLGRTLESADVPSLQLEVEALTTELVDAAAEWTALCAAHRMIELTLDRYKQERQPRVVRRAAELFAMVTDGSYQQLVVEESVIRAVDGAGRHVDAGALSRGAVEQLYLCIRFALAEELATTSPLPLLLDDVLVNADPHRSRQLARAVVDVAGRHQVFLFTCHPWVVDLVQAADPAVCHLVELAPPTAA
jgi:uncharacterized protein YhaN